MLATLSPSLRPWWLSAAILLVQIPFTGCEGDSGGDPVADASPAADAAAECQGEEARCAASGNPERCVAGRWQSGDPCPTGESCTNGACAPPPVCDPAESRCASAGLLEQCAEDGMSWESTP